MANVLEFHVELVGLEKIFWRDIQISDNSTIAKLGYVVMASFHGQACHLFNIKYEGKRYELLVEPDDFEGVLGPTFNPMKSKLRDFDFEPGNVLTMEYDYGAGWEWTIEYRNSFTLKKGAGKHYPYVTAGEGRGIIEDTSVGELIHIMKRIELTGEPVMVPYYVGIGEGDVIPWDHRRFNLDNLNGLLKYDVRSIQEAYEEPYNSGYVNPDDIYVSKPPVTGDNIIDFDAQRKWKSIYPQDKDILLTNAFCINCHVGMFKPGYTIRGVSNGDVAIDGECAGCGNKICRVVEKNWFKLK